MATIANNMHEYLLDNGFKLLIKEDHRSPIAIFQIFYKVGSSYEYNGITGISHVLEHMMFRGTQSYDTDKFSQKISAYGGQQNARTGHDYTTYYQIMPSDKLAYCFKFEADRMHNLLLNKKTFSQEMQIVMEERCMRIEDNPKHYTYERFCAIAYLSNPYRHPIIGWMNDLENMTIQDVNKWYQTWYIPNNAIGVIVGDVIPHQIYPLVKKYFGSLHPSILPPLKPQHEITPKGIRTVVVNIPAKLPWLIVGFNTPVVSTVDEKWEAYALLILCEILAGGRSARLQQNLVRGKQSAIEISYDYSPFTRMNTILALFTTPAEGFTTAELRDDILNEIDQIQNQLPYPRELERVKTQIIANKIYEEDSIDNQAHKIGNFEAIGLSWQDMENTYKEIAAITPEQVQKVACKYLTLDRLTLAILEPLPID